MSREIGSSCNDCEKANQQVADEDCGVERVVRFNLDGAGFESLLVDAAR